MLTHTTMPSLFEGEHLVVYKTPGCFVPTVVCVCRTAEQASTEADRLNTLQSDQEAAAQLKPCRMNVMSNDLGGEH